MAQRLGHWAWQPLRNAQPPIHAPINGATAAHRSHPVDAFVQQALHAARLQPSPAATPHEQLRRLWFDLVGLPPDPNTVRRFLANPSDAAYLQQVAELLASPHFGERWGRHWLDLVRYSETLGHEYDFELPNAWRYRDYVIRAFNQDVPYDQFVREHIAGDLLDKPRLDVDGNNESVQATASWWFCEQTHSPVDAMQHQADRIDNQIDVFGKAFLGMTVACARCHDHKFDAIPTRDYYSLFGYVKSSRYVQAPIRPVDTDSTDYTRVLNSQRTLAMSWLASLGGASGAGSAAPNLGALPHGVTLRTEDKVVVDATRYQTWQAPPYEPLPQGTGGWYRVNDGFGEVPWSGAFCANPAVAEPRLHRLPGAFWNSGAAGSKREGTLSTKTFALDHRFVHVRVAGRQSRVKLILDGFHIVRHPIYGDLQHNINREQAHWVTFDLGRWPGHQAHVMAIDQRAPDLGDPEHNRGRWPDDGWIALQFVINSPHAAPPETAPAPSSLDAGAARTSSKWRHLRQHLSAVMNELPVSATVPAMGDGDGLDSPVYLRGSHSQPGETAKRGFLSALQDAATQLGTVPQHSSGRLELARAVLAEQNPLPARVLVNRVWHHLFGRGIVKSVDNFGALGTPPTHPDLLDWIARDFQAHGWSIKHTVRRLVTSRTYRQSSRLRSDAQTVDANNELVHRQNVRALEAELVRDALLAASGRLEPKMYGRSIEQPEEAITKARGRPKRHDPRDGRGRRSVYMAIRRNFMPEMMLAFDLPTPFATVGRRNTSNVPAQALALANAPLVHELCERFAQRCLAHSDNDAQRLQLAYQLAFARMPRTDELHSLLAFVRQPGDPKTIWTDAVHALVNTTEFRFRR